MNSAKCDNDSYIDFLLANPRTYRCPEATRVLPDPCNPPASKAHDGLSKNDHFLASLETAQERGFEPDRGVFD